LRNKEIESQWRQISGSIDRIVACLDGLGERDLNWKPIESANSLWVLATHVLGSAEENILGVVCGHPVQRNRDAEFVAKAASPEVIQKRWSELRERMAQGLENITSAALSREIAHPRRGRMLGRDALVSFASHAAEHAGHAELTRDLLKSRG
jgi:hypothetical protein